ncbi:hypothetical protein JEQ12_001262 [Ovis aries]|uniref:Splicing regulator RBM11 n=1 Tax=Ovis aries TaxID=9940 RepID=A0A836AQK5_SHEEP|nr:hypothetical protein JEQ12_001262 [Ovis aries]
MLPAQEEANRTVFVGNLEARVREEILYELFLQAGPLTKVTICKDREGKPKSFGFVCFKHPESVSYAIALLNGIRLYGRPINVQYRFGSSRSCEPANQSFESCVKINSHSYRRRIDSPPERELSAPARTSLRFPSPGVRVDHVFHPGEMGRERLLPAGHRGAGAEYALEYAKLLLSIVSLFASTALSAATGNKDAIIILGYKKPLEREDLFELNESDSSYTVCPIFEKQWRKEVLRTQERQKVKDPSLSIVAKIVSISQSIISIDQIFLQTLILQQYQRFKMLTSAKIKTAVIGLIYKKALLLSNVSRKQFSTGEIINLMVTDAQQLMDLMTNINLLWSAPFQILMAVSLLWQELGPAVLAGVAVLVFVIPMNALVANRMKTLKKNQRKNKDKQIKLLNEILHGIKLILRHRESKIFAYETKDHAIGFINASFSWDKTGTPVLKDLNIRIPEGALVAVVGQVGSGKSSVLSAILGEMEKLKGVVQRKGSVAYVSQQAWIQNCILQENILFGSVMQKQLYERVLEACVLLPDLEQLPNGDQTEIGEKGVNISGGQKHRVCLARAVYSGADIYLLDDPLSAVDVHVAKQLFENVIGSSGMLRNKDMFIIDMRFHYYLRTWVNCTLDVIGTVLVIVGALPLCILGVIPLVFLYFTIQRYYMASSRQIRRLAGASRSPVISHFCETLLGVSTIRAFGHEQRFIQQNKEVVNENLVCFYNNVISNRWLSIRLEFLGNLMVFFTAVLTVLAGNSIDSAIVGLSISYALNITQTLNFWVRKACEIEANAVSIERVCEYEDMDKEAPWITSKRPPSQWPNKGVVEFVDYRARYRDDLGLALQDITFQTHGEEKVGIVGRTGAGKSTLSNCLFRIVERLGGKIIIDGIDISTIGLHDLRGKLNIIPQSNMIHSVVFERSELRIDEDPVLFSGTLRMNLDPLDKYPDHELWEVLELCHLKEFVQSLPKKLLHEISEGGENLSVGQRQLVCLARALLRKTKILILDEATASIDFETDNLVQTTIRKEFSDCTILTIAHRLHSIIDSDRPLSHFFYPLFLLNNFASPCFIP